MAKNDRDNGQLQSNDAVEWISAQAAASEIAVHYESLETAKLALASGLHDGLFSCRAAAFEWERAEVVERIPHGAAQQTDNLIPADFWRETDDLEGDLEEWDWRFGTFTIVQRHPFPGRRLTVRGVQFRKDEVQSVVDGGWHAMELSEYDFLLGDEHNEEEQSRPPATARARIYNWEPVWADLAAKIHKDGFEAFGGEDQRGTQASLERWFVERFRRRNMPVPSEAECRKRAQWTLDAIRKA
jgi:hypothetical protein